MEMKVLQIIVVILLNSTLCFTQVNRNLEANFHEDTLWKADIPIKIEQFVELRKYVLRNQQSNRYHFFKELTSSLLIKVSELDSIYQLEIEEFVSWMNHRSIDKKPIGYSYISTKLEFEKLLHLPKCYAILLNPARRNISKKLELERFNLANKLVEEILSIIEENDKFLELEKEAVKYMEEVKVFESQLFKGRISNELKLKYGLIDYLLLASRGKSEVEN